VLRKLFYIIKITHQAKKDIDKLAPKLKEKLKDVLIEVISQNPYEGKKLLGDLRGSYSYRLSYKDRIVYYIDENKKIVYIERARTHYGE
jgi:Txe/YoeB family toxin of toxin-antitoxin system